MYFDRFTRSHSYHQNHEIKKFLSPPKIASNHDAFNLLHYDALDTGNYLSVFYHYDFSRFHIKVLYNVCAYIFSLMVIFKLIISVLLVFCSSKYTCLVFWGFFVYISNFAKLIPKVSCFLMLIKISCFKFQFYIVYC